MTDNKKILSSNPRNKNIGIRVTEQEKKEIQEVAQRLELTITDTVVQGVKALDEKYRLIKK